MDGSTILSKTSILNIDYNKANNNLIIYNEFNSIIYNHNHDRYFLFANRDIEYTINYLNNSYLGNTIFHLCKISKVSNELITSINETRRKFIFTDLSIPNENVITNSINSINSSIQNSQLYYLYIKCTVNSIDNVFKIPLLFLDQFLIQPQQNSYNNSK